MRVTYRLATNNLASVAAEAAWAEWRRLSGTAAHAVVGGVALGGTASHGRGDALRALRSSDGRVPVDGGRPPEGGGGGPCMLPSGASRPRRSLSTSMALKGRWTCC